MIAIVSAMPEELAPALARASDLRPVSSTAPLPRLVVGRWAGKAVALAVTGDGERNARLGARALGAALTVDELVVVGIAGAASSELPSGALVVAEEVGFADGVRWSAPAASVERAVRRTGARAVRLVSARDIADSPAAKRELAARAGEADAPLAVDLESATYVAAAIAADVPWTVLRVISDAADEVLPGFLNGARDAGGAVRRGAVVLSLLGAPGALPVLWRMRARLKAAGTTLADAVEKLIR